MPSLPDPAFLEARLRRSGLSRLAARRMAGEWLDHLEDLADAGRAAGLSDNAALEEALARLGSATRLIEHRCHQGDGMAAQQSLDERLVHLDRCPIVSLVAPRIRGGSAVRRD